MKILHILWNFTIGGVQTMLVDIMNLQVVDHCVSIIVIDKEVDYGLVNSLDRRIKFINLSRNNGSKNILSILKLNFYVYREHTDIVHFHMQGIVKYIFIPILKVRTIHNSHSSFSEYHKYKKLYAISEGVKKYTIGQGFQDVEVIYNGIHPSKINFTPVKKMSNDGCRHFIVLGRLHKMKGQAVAIEAFNILINKRHYIDVCLDFIGDGQEREEYEKLVKKYGIENFVNFLGMKPKEYFYPKLCEYDLYIQPSISEGFGLTIAEAMCAKLPVIISNLEGPMEVIGNGKYGAFFESGNPSSLADEIENYLIYGVDNEKIEAGYRFVCENFNIINTVKKYINEYDKILGLKKNDV